MATYSLTRKRGQRGSHATSRRARSGGGAVVHATGAVVHATAAAPGVAGAGSACAAPGAAGAGSACGLRRRRAERRRRGERAGGGP
ncbi:hypothetical protein [Sorangium cellulosum]|uniref:Uncharacterized protein n=1 Tax=Sorangium cellulosum So0157-2 TaxID=1254432 RepID=S4XSC2_SORCE|nr:hypothetical protein [Sorangium cellulosum]AGP33478.1 hypothetical protein SCE1572_02500 [Sorangium cellulosum So0157-2]